MKKMVNGRISKADVRVYPDIIEMQIELLISMQRGNVLFRMPASADSMMHLYQVFNSDSIYDLHGKYCRVCFDENDNIEYIDDIMYDSSAIANDPVV